MIGSHPTFWRNLAYGLGANSFNLMAAALQFPAIKLALDTRSFLAIDLALIVVVRRRRCKLDPGLKVLMKAPPGFKV